MPEPEAELQATANLSPVSPSPVHTASPLVVPALQDTVDTIDAMVAAVVASTSQTSAADDAAPAHAAEDSLDPSDLVDDDPYGDDTQPEAAPKAEPEAPNTNDDDYAKTFDSPIASDHEDEGHQQEARPSDPPLSNHPSVASHSVLDPLLAQASATDIIATPPQTGDAAAPASSQAPQGQSQTGQQAAPSSAPEGAHNGASTAESAIDLQRLVADITAQSNQLSSHPTPDANAVQAPQTTAPSLSTSGLPTSSTLPPRPPLPNTASQSFVSQHHPGGANLALAAGNAALGQPAQMLATGAPGTTAAINSLPPAATHASAANPVLNAFDYTAGAPGHTNDSKAERRRAWEQFLADERQYMSEAKWDRFPEGSRIFIGNLSSDKVSKRDVFDVFHAFGKLAQISLKTAYGFVQYHTVDEGRRAIQAMEGAEIKGRRIHLEISKLQDKSKKDRGRSPDNNKGRGGREGGRRGEKHGNQSRDDYRPRNYSPRRNDHGPDMRERERERDRGYHDGGRNRNRSRSPGFGRNSRDYRRRSPSPYGRNRPDSEIDLPRRYGADVPDVQIILQPDVHREFSAWVEGAFKSKGLRTEVMFLHPRIPKDQIIQRQAVEGVHAVVDLDLRAQHLGKIPVQAFDRSAGASNVRYDQYVDLDPNIAAEVILRTKASSVPSYGGQPYPTHGSGAGGYDHSYRAHGQPPANSYNGVPSYPAHSLRMGGQGPEVAGLQLDPPMLNQLISTLQNGNAGPAAVRHGGAPTQQDIQAILSTLGGAQAAQAPQQAPPGPPQYPAAYPPQAAAPYQAPANGDSAAQVQNIMAQLARYRQ